MLEKGGEPLTALACPAKSGFAAARQNPQLLPRFRGRLEAGEGF